MTSMKSSPQNTQRIKSALFGTPFRKGRFLAPKSSFSKGGVRRGGRRI